MSDEQRSRLIAQFPIGKGLDAFRTFSSSICKGSEVASRHDALARLQRQGEKTKSVTVLI